jgi:hypothetical protein
MKKHREIYKLIFEINFSEKTKQLPERYENYMR